MQKKTGLIGFIHKLPKKLQLQLIGIGFLQRKQTYITHLPGMLPMLKDGEQTPEFKCALQKHNIGKAESIFIDMDGEKLHALYLPPENGKLICAFHGIKGNWLNNPPAINPDPKDANYDPTYRMVLLEEFARAGFGFLAFTMPGFNPSESSASEVNFNKACGVFADYTIKLAAECQLQPKDIVICGESLGGAVAAIFASKLTIKSFPPAVVSLIATFDSLVGMTQNEFPIFSTAELSAILKDKLDTTEILSKLDKNNTWLHIVAVEGDSIIPLKNTLNLLSVARGLGFNVLYHLTQGDHTTWDKSEIVGGKKTAYMAREKGLKIAELQSVKDIQAAMGDS